MWPASVVEDGDMEDPDPDELDAYLDALEVAALRFEERKAAREARKADRA